MERFLDFSNMSVEHDQKFNSQALQFCIENFRFWYLKIPWNMEKPEMFQENVRLVSVPLMFIKYNSRNEVKNVFQQKF